MEPIKITVEINAPALVQAINSLAHAIAGAHISSNPVTGEPEKVEKAEKTTKAKKETKPVEQPPQEKPAEDKPANDKPEEKPDGDIVTYTAEQVRAKLRSLADSGKSTEMKQIISSFGVSKLSEIPADKYAEVMGLAEKAEKDEALA